MGHPSVEDLARRWINRLASVRDLGARRALWVEALGTQPAAQAAVLLEQVVAVAVRQQPKAVLTYLPLLDLPSLRARVGPGVLGALLLAARQAQLDKCLYLLEYPGPAAGVKSLGPPPDPLVENMTLGHRKVAARGPRTALLERILHDPEPRVVRELLRNPRLREGEVVAVASRRPLPEAAAWLLVGAPDWVQRPAVRRALLRNPHTPPQLGAALAVLASGGELGEVAKDEGLHPAVRDGALCVLEWRRAPGRTG